MTMRADIHLGFVLMSLGEKHEAEEETEEVTYGAASAALFKRLNT